ncbi:MFS transporter [Marinibacterium profundimaris]|uniref:MFS transporter n=2 Tax=Marinibacterium profundimaris TaxID=1679460 RepID=A0A225NLZ9_9RHOB|nr:MFS transporter [Marinibacterium profundimaris]
MQRAQDESAKLSVQQWIDQTPAWPDGTPVNAQPMTSMQTRIWALAAAGKFFEGMVVFMGGIALPLVAKEFAISKAQHGLVTAASLAGILVGASLLGGLSDRFGRRVMFIAEMALFTLFLIAVCLSPNFGFLVAALFGLGLALGCDYPTAHVMISETISSRIRGRQVLSAFGFQAIGALFGTGVGYLILANTESVQAWRWMYATGILPALVVLGLRFTIIETPHWLLARNRIDEAVRATLRLLSRAPAYPTRLSLHHEPIKTRDADRSGWAELFSPANRRATLLASVPWFLQDLGTYGIGIFTPVILTQTVGHTKEHATSVADIVQNDMIAARGAAMIDVLLLIGILFAILLADRLGRIPLQIAGFIGCAAGLAIAAMSSAFDGMTATIMIFGGFMLFNFATNVGPNAQTYLVAGEVFPVHVRAKGAGFAASFAKIGAVSTAFLFPILLADIGTEILLWGLVGTSILGAVVTYVLRIETAGRSLEEIETA